MALTLAGMHNDASPRCGVNQGQGCDAVGQIGSCQSRQDGDSNAHGHEPQSCSVVIEPSGMTRCESGCPACAQHNLADRTVVDVVVDPRFVP